MLGRGRLGDVNGLLERPPQVNGALLDHLPDVFDPVLLVLDARGLGRILHRGQMSQGSNPPLEFLVVVLFFSTLFSHKSEKHFWTLVERQQLWEPVVQLGYVFLFFFKSIIT